MKPLPFTDADRSLLVALRRDLHRHPELAWKETVTQARLERALRDVGATDIRRVATTGLVARIPGVDRKVPTVAIRGDIDALPITEATGLDFASQSPGVMHACGHDIHASWALGAALLLARRPAGGDVTIVLQPAEEIGEGALAILESGALSGVTTIFGAHVDRRFAVGEVVAQAGPLAAGADTFAIALKGRGAHGARPQQSADPVVGAAELIMAIQTIVSRRLDPALPGVVTVAAVHGGLAPNVIPDVVELAGTIRATTRAARDLIVSELERITHAVAAVHRLTAVVDVSDGTPPLENTVDAAACAAAAVRDALGDGALMPLGTTNMGAEDFACYLGAMSGCFLRIGAREAGGEYHDAHTSTFVPAEEALFVGAAVLAQCAREASRSR